MSRERQVEGDGHDSDEGWSGSLREAWSAAADEWMAWARREGHDSYWQFHRGRFLDLVPAPGRLTVDVGCGEGRVGRDLAAAGHRVVGLDVVEPVAAAAHRAGALEVLVSDAAAVALRGAVADLVVAFMSPQDIDDLAGALREMARILVPDGQLCLAAVHPINSAGLFEAPEADGLRPFVIRGSYFENRRYQDVIVRDGLRMTFTSDHRSLEEYFRLLAEAGFVVEDLREVGADDPDDKWHRMPLFVHIRARRKASGTAR